MTTPAETGVAADAQSGGQTGAQPSAGASVAPATEAADFLEKYGVTPAQADHDTLVRMITDLLNDGLKTQTEPFPEDNKEFADILEELRGLSADQLREKLVISGWLLKPYGEDEMRCQECMYFLFHKRWCDLPELMLPAEPDWWCRLWRI